MKEKTGNPDFIKMKTICSTKEALKRHLSCNGLVFKAYEDLLIRKQPNLKMDKVLGISPKKIPRYQINT